MNLTQDLKVKGIYKISSLGGDKVYIGSTFHAGGIYRRAQEHLRFLKKNKHHSRILQNYYNKHGENSLKISILEIVKDKTLLIKREQYWIDFYIQGGNKLLNGSKTAKAALSIDFSFRHKKVYQFSLDGELLKSWNSIKEAEKELNCGKGTISGAINGLMKTYKGFIYQDNPNFKPPIYKTNKTYSKRIKCLNDNKEFDSLTKASLFYNIDISTISDNLRKGLNNKKKLKFTYL